MLIAIPLAALIFLAGHWFVAALLRRSLFRPALVWRAPWTTKLAVWAAGPVLVYLIAAIAAFPEALAAGDMSLTVDPVPGMPAAAAGVSSGDRVIAIDRQPVAHWAEVPKAIRSAGDRDVELELERDGRRVQLRVPARSGQIGIRPRADVAPLPRAAANALLMPFRVIDMQARALARITSVEVSGPVGIVRASSQPGPALSTIVALLLSSALPLVLVLDGLMFFVLSFVALRRE